MTQAALTVETTASFGAFYRQGAFVASKRDCADRSDPPNLSRIPCNNG